MTWEYWAIAGVILLVMEMMTGAFIAAPLAGGAFAGAIAVAITGSPVIGAVAMAVVALAALLWLRPIAVRHQNTQPSEATNIAKLIGTEAVVLQTTDRDTGLVRIGGEQWTARSDGPSYEPNTRLIVDSVSGATVTVRRAD